MAGLTDMEKDTIAEVGNISMGAAATTLATLTGKAVHITTPKVSEGTLKEVREGYPSPCFIADVRYKKGLRGSNVFVLKEEDVAVIAALMMGMPPEDVSPENLGEIETSAVREAMNQMIASASTSMSDLFNRPIDITPPTLERYEPEDLTFGTQTIDSEDQLARISFRLAIEGLIDSNMEQVLPLDFAKEAAVFLLTGGEEAGAIFSDSEDEDHQPPEIQITPEPAADSLDDDFSLLSEEPFELTEDSGYDDEDDDEYDEDEDDDDDKRVLLSKDMDDADYDEVDEYMSEKLEKLEMVRDMPLELTVVLGKSRVALNELFETGNGGVISLNQYAREPVDIMVKDRLVARGEVVVVDGKLGVRIVSMETILPELS